MIKYIMFLLLFCGCLDAVEDSSELLKEYDDDGRMDTFNK